MNKILAEAVALAEGRIAKVGGKAGRANAFGTGKPASKKQQRTYMANRQAATDYQRDSGRADGSSKAGRDADRRIIGGNLRRAGSYSPLRKAIAKARAARKS